MADLIGSPAAMFVETAMTHPPLVSILLPVLNAERFLAQALDSIQAQTYPHYELIIIDGGSSDGTAALARTAPRARWLAQTGAGLANAWNTGLSAAQGEYISFIESDDLWRADKLDVQVHHLKQHTSFQYVIAQVQLFLEPGCPPPAGLNPDVFAGSHVGRMPGTLMARRALFEQIGMFEDRWRVTPDIDWFARLAAEQVPGAVLPEVLLYRRIHESNLTQVAGPSLVKTELLQLLKQNMDRRRRRAAPEGFDTHGV